MSTAKWRPFEFFVKLVKTAFYLVEFDESIIAVLSIFLVFYMEAHFFVNFCVCDVLQR